MNIYNSIIVKLLSFALILVGVVSDSTGQIVVSNRLEMFIDNAAIKSITGDLQQQLIQPEPKEVVLITDAAWEGNGCAYWAIFKDGDKFRMVYRGWQLNDTGDPNQPEQAFPENSCIAESVDGIVWTRPNVGLYDWNGSTSNNIVVKGPTGSEGTSTHNLTVFKDTNPNCVAGEEYKALARWGYNLRAYKSTDCKNWTGLGSTLGYSISESEDRGTFDSQNLAFWDPVIGQYRAYWRDYISGIRSIVTATSSNCYDWIGDYDLTYTQGTFGSETNFPATAEHLYTSAVQQYYRNQYIYIGFPARYNPGNSQVEPLLMSSRDGKNFHRYPIPVIPITAPADRNTNRSNYMQLGMLELPGRPGEVSVYASENYDIIGSTPARLRRFVYRVDGFVALRSGAIGGQLETTALNYYGNQLLLNYLTESNGYVKVEVLNTSGQVIGSSGNLTGDVIDDPVSWVVDPGLSSGTISLRFTVQNADLYSYRFNQKNNDDLTDDIIVDDAEHGTTVGWSVYDNLPAGAVITNVVDPDNASNRVIKLEGTNTDNGYKRVINYLPEDEFQFQWRMKYSELFVIYIRCETTTGNKYLLYNSGTTDGPSDSDTIRYGLGPDTILNNWVTITRNIQQDIWDSQPNCNIIEVSDFLVRASGYIDDIVIKIPRKQKGFMMIFK